MIENAASAAVNSNFFVGDAPEELEIPPNILDQLENSFGVDDVSSAIADVFAEFLGEMIKGVINNTDVLPEFLKEAAIDAIDESLVENESESTAEAKSAVEEIMGNVLQQASEGAAEEAEAEANHSGGGGRNWLAVLAKAMGDVAGKHLQESVSLANKITEIGQSSSAEQAAQEMPGLQAQMQAETQLFKMAQEATSTIVKSVGEALTGTARKQ